MKNINPYNRAEFVKTFSNSDLYKTLVEDFDLVNFEWAWHNHNVPTPRQIYGKKIIQTEFSAVPFYYIQYLLDKTPETIYDLGCGWNIFKKYIPNIIGIGAEYPSDPTFFANIHDFVDKGFVKGHNNYFESVFSINALHFCPLSEFSIIVNNFYSMIKPGGRGFLALNVKRMVEQDPKFYDIDPMAVEQWVRNELDKILHIQFLVVDIQFDNFDEYMNGNIRLVLEKDNS